MGTFVESQCLGEAEGQDSERQALKGGTYDSLRADFIQVWGAYIRAETATGGGVVLWSVSTLVVRVKSRQSNLEGCVL